MKRHLVPPSSMAFDTRSRMLTDEIRPEWADDVKATHRANYENLIASLSVELGPIDFHRKLADFKDIGLLPFSIISYHNGFLEQIRRAFVQGYYYPALTAACALGERILNHLVIDLRDHFRDRKSHSKVASGESFDKWQQLIYVLDDWGVLRPDAITAMRKLEIIRHRSLHYSEKTYGKLREEALDAIRLLTSCINAQFSAFGTQPWFIRGTKGAAFIKAEWETNPFVREFYLPICPSVGIYYSLNHSSRGWELFDFKDYDERIISDDEFCQLYNERDHTRLAPTSVPPPEHIERYIFQILSRPAAK